MTNREYIHRCTNLYDNLLELNRAIRSTDNPRCIKELLTAGQELGCPKEFSEHECGECIEEWLNSEHTELVGGRTMLNEW